MKTKAIRTAVVTTVALAAFVSAALPTQQQDKYSVKVPGGLEFAEFRGYENWATIAVHRNENFMNVIVGDPVAMAAFRAGIPDNGEPFPDGSRMAKIEWYPAKGSTFPYDTQGALYHVELMVKDTKRFAESGGWGYAVFAYDSASGRFTPGGSDHLPPQGNDAKCGAACHTVVQARDYVFTEYGNR